MQVSVPLTQTLTSTSPLLGAALLIKPCYDRRCCVLPEAIPPGHPFSVPLEVLLAPSGPVSRGSWAAGATQERGLERGAEGHKGKLKGTEPGASKWAQMGSL